MWLEDSKDSWRKCAKNGNFSLVGSLLSLSHMKRSILFFCSGTHFRIIDTKNVWRFTKCIFRLRIHPHGVQKSFEHYSKWNGKYGDVENCGILNIVVIILLRISGNMRDVWMMSKTRGYDIAVAMYISHHWMDIFTRPIIIHFLFSSRSHFQSWCFCWAQYVTLPAMEFIID